MIMRLENCGLPSLLVMVERLPDKVSPSAARRADPGLGFT